MDKVTIALIGNHTYLTYRMVYQTLTDLWTRRACLSASAELLVFLSGTAS